MSKNNVGQLIEFNNTNKETLRVLDFIDSYKNQSACRDLAKNEFNLDQGAQKISDIYFRI